MGDPGSISRRIDFEGATGARLAGRLDLPAVGAPRAHALFAHCFTCSKDLNAANRIASGLAARGFAVLRFDFTGLGSSEGEFANTDFSSNVADLVAAARYLDASGAAAELLVGHSLGGAAVLAAAAGIPSVRAVATIGAPADAEHVKKQFHADLARIEAEGRAEVMLAGRPFFIRREFLRDIEAQRLEEAVSTLKRPLLVFHAPRDMTVGVDNAGQIFRAAKHPKSFVSLDDADHLLSRREDAAYVAEVLAAWAGRYVSPAPEAEATRLVTVAETGAGRFQQLAAVGPHRLIADEPVSVGGGGTGPDPYGYLAVALGACTTMTLRMYATRRGLDLGRLSVTVEHAKVHAEDCAECGEGREGRIDRFERVISVEGETDHATRSKLLEIADKCPVHRTLEASSIIVTKLAGEGEGQGVSHKPSGASPGPATGAEG
jgi:uncharacterized OsmC-like protein/pimeloyl-ACP methyl ester carboxylesterase